MTSFYSVNSDYEPEVESKQKVVTFGQSYEDLFNELVAEDEKNMSPSRKSTFRKLRQIFRTSSKAEYDIQPGQDITTAYIDLPKVSVNPLYNDEQEMIEETSLESSTFEEPILTVQPSTR